MSLELKINEDIKTAMKAKAEATLRSLRAIKAEILKAKTAEGFSGSLSEDDEIKILTRMLKQRRDSLSVYQSQQRADLAAKEQEEIAVIESFMPQQLSADELKTALQAIIAELGAAGPKDMGKVMGVASKKFAAVADGKLVAETVKQLLNNA
ncbi:MAG: GatB/YqeY domain-containing protein [Chitinophagales bacterium]|mgnify:CR=1 FL=1|jgi:uncharacterized protein YqeY|nr:GatB/YqeY domain-containing protein [Chitinophagales bacterium]